MAGEDLPLYGGQVQGLGDLLVVISIPGAESQGVNLAHSTRIENSRDSHICELTFSLGGGSKGVLPELVGKNLQKTARFRRAMRYKRGTY